MSSFLEKAAKPKARSHHGKWQLTDEQWVLHDGIWQRDKNIAGNAVAGSGKTFTILEVMWSAKSGVRVAYLVFSKDMEMSMKDRIPPGSICKTCHAFGYQALAEKVKPNKIDVQGGGYGKKSLNQMILSQFKGYNTDTCRQEDYADTKDRIDSACKLIDMIRANLIDWKDQSEVDRIADYYGINTDPDIYDILPKVFKEIIEKGVQGIIDFTSMYWLVVYLDLPMPNKLDLLLVDEYQDLSACQRKFVMMLGKGAIIGIIGDPRQSIFGFAGATPNSMQLGIEELNAVEYPITYNFRCGRKIIESVQHIVPHIKAWSGASEGELVNVNEEGFDYCSIPDDSLALSRVNSDLVRPAFQRIKKGKRANIKGRDLKYGIETIYRKIKKKAGQGASLPMLIGTSSDLENLELEALTNRKNVSQSLIELTRDRYETFRIICDQIERPEDFKSQVKDLFDPKKGGVVFSSMHRAKGLEAPEVYILRANRMTISHPDLKDWQNEQEQNLVYMAQTRPKDKLVKIFREEKK